MRNNMFVMSKTEIQHRWGKGQKLFEDLLKLTNTFYSDNSAAADNSKM